MKNAASLLKSALFGLVAGLLAAVPALAAPRAELGASPLPMTVQADCHAIGQQVAAQNGGTLAKASLSNKGGQPVCVIVVVVPGKDGQRGERKEIVVPAG